MIQSARVGRRAAVLPRRRRRPASGPDCRSYMRVERAQGWDDEEVARRWLRLCPPKSPLEGPPATNRPLIGRVGKVASVR